MCRNVLCMLGTRPSVRSAGGSVSAVGHAPLQRVGGKLARAGATSLHALRVATWNIAGGKRSSQASEKWSPLDQREAIAQEVLRWGADVVALQECEDAAPYDRLTSKYDFVGSAAAVETRGHVHVYLKRGGALRLEELETTVKGDLPAVEACMAWASGGWRTRVLAPCGL